MSSRMKNRIYNPVTGKYYKPRQRSSKFGQGGQKEGLWTKDSHESNEAKDTSTSPPNVRRVKVCGNCGQCEPKFKWVRIDEHREFIDVSTMTVYCKKFKTEGSPFLTCDVHEDDPL